MTIRGFHLATILWQRRAKQLFRKSRQRMEKGDVAGWLFYQQQCAHVSHKARICMGIE